MSFFTSILCFVFFFFFFQAEDGIRDVAVTGVQTCALPIWVDGLASVEAPARAPAKVAEDVGQLLTDDPLTDELVGQVEVDEEVVVEEMSERPVADVVQEPGHAQRSEEHTSELQSRLHLVCRLL